MAEDEGQDGRGMPWRFNFDPESLIGWTVANKYKIVRHLGGGGFGEVYEAYNINLKAQRVVVKFLKQIHSRERFRQEAEILCMFDHPNINRIVEYLADDRAVIMPFIDGKDGEQLLKDSGPLAEDTLLSVARSLTSAMAFAHERGIAHRDIKPGNIMIDHHRQVYLIDFGIAKKIDSTGLTQTGKHPLTPQYAAPERFEEGRDYNPILSDIYEIGSTLFKLATNLSPMEFAKWRASSDYSHPRVNRLSNRFLRILRKATEDTPSQRYQTVGELRRDLAGLSRVYRRTGMRRVLIPVVILCALAAVAYVYRAPLMNGIDQLSSLFDGSGKQGSTSNDNTTDESSDVVALDDTMSVLIDAVSNDDIPVEPDNGRDVATENNAVAATTESAVDSVPEAVTPPPSKPTKPKIPVVAMRIYPGDAKMYIDDKYVPPESGGEGMYRVPLKPGTHAVTLASFNFPIFRSRFTLATDTAIVYDLDDIFRDSLTCLVRIGAVPSLEAAKLQATFNSFSRVLSVPTRMPGRILGEWDLRFELVGGGGAIDSIRVKNGSMAQMGKMFRGSRAEVDLRDFSTGSDLLDVIIYWE